MMRTPNCRRPGLSLTEVLVALFVMALGIISLMTLFPLGAVQMGQALRDDRSGQTASQADGIVRLWWQTEVAEVRKQDIPGFINPSSPTAGILTLPLGHNILANEQLDVKWLVAGVQQQRLNMTVGAVSPTSATISGGTGTNLPAGPTAVTVQLYEDAFWQAMDNPGLLLPTKIPISPAVYDNFPSYPVFLDPIGYNAFQGQPLTQQIWVGNSAGGGNMPRRSTRSLLSPTPQRLTLAVRGCSMMDDITFGEDGKPDQFSGATQVVREGAYNWCAVIQRPNNANRYTADFKVCVFHTKGLYGGHVPGLASPNAERLVTLPAPALKDSTQVVIPDAPGNLPLRSGSWIMDGTTTVTMVNGLPVTNKVANFYRIQSITENPLNVNQTILELDTPLKSNATDIYIIRGLADVFDRPQLTASGYSQQKP